MIANNLKTQLLIILLAMLGLSAPTALRAQHQQASLAHYSTDDGLASNASAHMTSDDYGYLWIATWNGVSRFDGFHFYNYKTGNASGIRGLHNRVDGLYVDQAQNIWMKMYDGRIFVINRQTDCIQDPLAGIGGHDEFRLDYFYTPYITSSGDILLSFKDVGIYKLRLNRNGIHRQLIMTSQLTANCIVEGYHGDLWVGTEKGVHRIDMPNLTLERKGYFLDENITRLTSNGYNIFASTRSGKIMQFSYGQEPKLIKDIGREITSLYVDSRGLLWYSDLGDGAYRLNPTTGDIKFFRQNVLVPEFTSRGAFFKEAMGVLWVRLNHGGYGYYNRETDEIEYFHNDPVNPWNLSNSVNANLEMDDGVVWESTSRRGLDKLEIMKNTIERRLLMPGAESSLDNEVRGMCHDSKRNVTLLANKRGKVFVFDSKGNVQSVITHDANGLAISRPYGISADSKGNYWICDKDNGVFKVTPTGGGYNVVNFRHSDSDPYSLSHHAASQAVEDRQGNIWIATYGGGVNVLRKDKSGRYVALHYKNVMKRYPHNAYLKVRTIALSSDGQVWAGTTDGILLMQIRNENIVIEQMDAPADLSKGLMSNDITYLACDRQGVMWVGTNSGGLSHTTSKDANGTWQFDSYTISDGIPSEEIRSITFDERGNVWFATDHILSSFDVRKQIFTTFSNLDGVDDTMCSEGAAITLSNGIILFGTMNGYYVVDRKKLQNSTGSLLRLRITDFFLDDQLQSPRLDSTLTQYVPETMEVELPHNNSRIAFRFAALNSQLQHRVHYQYMLEDYDDDWQNADKTRTATYEDLPWGTYTFKVKAFLLESPEAYDMRTVSVVVPPPFLLSSTAIWIYLGLAVLIALLVLWRRQEHLRRLYKPVADARETDGDEDATPDSPHAEEPAEAYEVIS